MPEPRPAAGVRPRKPRRVWHEWPFIIGVAFLTYVALSLATLRLPYFDQTTLAYLFSVVAASLTVGVLAGFLAARRAGAEWRRSQTTHCRHCGYDLRATPERCPECGAVPAGPESSSTEPAA